MSQLLNKLVVEEFPKSRAYRTTDNGKRKRTYPGKDYDTPYEKLMSLPKWEGYLKGSSGGVSPLDKISTTDSLCYSWSTKRRPSSTERCRRGGSVPACSLRQLRSRARS